MLISNPFASALFQPLAGVVGGLLGSSLALLLAFAGARRTSPARNVLVTRWLVWAGIAPLFGLAVLGGPFTLSLLVGLVSVQCLREFSSLVGLPGSYRAVLLSAGAATAPLAALSPDALYVFPPLLLVCATLQPLLASRGNGKAYTLDGVRHLAFATFGWAYLAWLPAHLVLIGEYRRGGTGVLLALAIAVALSDVGAFVVGKAAGKHRLAPLISPNKTWEGVVGNLLGACAGVSLMLFALPIEGRLLLALLLPPVIAAGAVWGDLLESSVKREFGVKDAGNWLPGFGGLLDRVDSLIIVAPLVFYLLKLLGWS